MPSPHLERKLKDSLGNEAGEELVGVIDRVDPIRGDIAELRHAMDKGFADQRAELEHAMLIQTRWMLGGLALILTAILFKGS